MLNLFYSLFLGDRRDKQPSLFGNSSTSNLQGGGGVGFSFFLFSGYYLTVWFRLGVCAASVGWYRRNGNVEAHAGCVSTRGACNRGYRINLKTYRGASVFGGRSPVLSWSLLAVRLLSAPATPTIPNPLTHDHHGGAVGYAGPPSIQTLGNGGRETCQGPGIKPPGLGSLPGI